MNSKRTTEDDLARDSLTEFLPRAADPDTFLTFRHYRVPNPLQFIPGVGIVDTGYAANGGVTFCVVAEPDSKLLHVTVAECSKRDLFNKNIAREIAMGRFLRIGEFVTIEWDRDVTIAENLERDWDDFCLRSSPFHLELSVKNRYVNEV